MTFRFDSCLVICHGKSEKIFMESIKSNLRLKFAIYAHNNGNNSIQITSLLSHLNNTKHKSLTNLKRNYTLDIIHKNKINNFKVFIIMDFDEKEYSAATKNAFLDKSMFNNHYLKEYIVPIFNINNFDEIFRKAGYEINSTHKRKSYEKIFPARNGDFEAFLEVKEKIAKVDKKLTNMSELLDYLHIQFNNKPKY